MTDRFEPFPAEQLPLVRIAAEVAAAKVLDYKRETGWPDPEIAWGNGDCTLLALYVPGPRSMAPVPPPPFAVYLVRLTHGASVTWVMVDAASGEIRAAFGSGLIPSCVDA